MTEKMLTIVTLAMEACWWVVWGWLKFAAAILCTFAVGLLVGGYFWLWIHNAYYGLGLTFAIAVMWAFIARVSDAIETGDL